jgi:hypothetical protein
MRCGGLFGFAMFVVVFVVAFGHTTKRAPSPRDGALSNCARRMALPT